MPWTVLTVLCHPDLSRIGDRAFLGELARERKHKALLSRKEPRFRAPGKAVGEPLDDPCLSRKPLEIEQFAGGIQIHRSGSHTCLTVDGLPVEESLIIPSEALDHGVVLELSGRIVLLLHRRLLPLQGPLKRFGLVGESAEMEAVRQAITRVAPLDMRVILRGETGTGKELVARALHEHGPRASHPFVGVNLAAITPSLAAAQLFGAVKGAYTGAEGHRPGYFVSAHGGTLFLDEVGEAPTEIQVLLLRALETGEIVPVGGHSPRRVDVRVVSATDVDLDAALRSNSFRSALLHRLAGYTIRLPPLRCRREDLGRLLIYFLRRELGERLLQLAPASKEPWLPASLVVRLALYDWPGNVRELANLVRQMVIDSQGEPVLRLDPDWGRNPSGKTGVCPAPPEPAAPWHQPSDIPEDEILAALEAHQWNVQATAKALNVARTSLYSWMDRCPRIQSAANVPAEEIRLSHERCGGDLDCMAAELKVSKRGLRQRLKDLGLR